MQVHSMHFKSRARAALADPQLQRGLAKVDGFAQKRAEVVSLAGDFELWRTAGTAIRDRVLENLDVWIEQFEREATRRGVAVLYAETGEEAAGLVLEICARHGLKKAIKSKSMLSEEAQLNRALETAGVRPVETDLGEYVCQLSEEPPSHIIPPII